MMVEEKWTLVIVPKTGFFKLDFGELWRYRDLLVMYIRRDIVTFYKQTKFYINYIDCSILNAIIVSI